MSEMWHEIRDGNFNYGYGVNVKSSALDVEGGKLYRTIVVTEKGPAIAVTFVPEEPTIKPRLGKDKSPVSMIGLPDIADEDIRELLSCKDVASGRAILWRLLRNYSVI